MQQRTIFIGDIHGCYDEFINLLDKLKYDVKKDRLISLGDIIHKGPYSAKVLDYFINSSIEVICGNHEDWLMRSLKGEAKASPWQEEVLSESSFSAKEIEKWISNLPLYIKGEGFLAVHAGLSAYDKIAKTSRRNLLTMRYVNPLTKEFYSKNKLAGLVPWFEEFCENKSGEEEVIYGHWAATKIKKYDRTICLDTGCCYGGNLSAYILPTKEIFQVESQQKKLFNY